MPYSNQLEVSVAIHKDSTKEPSGKMTYTYRVNVEAINLLTGRRVQKRRSKISSLPMAKKIERELWNICRNGSPNDVTKNWGRLLLSYLEDIEVKVRSQDNPYGWSPQHIRTVKGRFSHIQHWGGFKVSKITIRFIEQEMDELERKGVSRQLTAKVQEAVKAVFSFALESGFIKYNPVEKMKKRKVPEKRKKALNHIEAQTLLFEAKKRNHSFYDVWLLALVFGLRRSEIDGLHWSDFDFDSGLLTVERQFIPGEGYVYNPKDKEERVVPIPEFALSHLQRMKLRSEGKKVITLDDRRWISGHQARVTRDFCREIGIKEVTFHQLRATYITLALVDNIPLGIVKEAVGHSNLTTLNRYFRSSGVDMRGQMDSLKLKLPSEDEGSVINLKVAD
jgi:integrase